MRNLKLVLAYDGSEFSGWQVQPDAATIQGTLASAIGRVTGEKVLPQASGRTDAGVHALAQVATFVTESPMPARNLVKALNDILPPSIRVIESNDAPLEFHARKSAHAKTYRYRIYRGAICSPFLARYVWHYPFPLDHDAMQEAAGLVIGKHDFTSFAAVDSERSRKDETNSEVGHAALSNVRKIFASAPHGPQSGGNIHARGKRNIETGRHHRHFGGTQPFGRWSHSSGERTVSGECRILKQYEETTIMYCGSVACNVSVAGNET
jgi:tRNA pseudouridine38-40 synthase